MTEFWIDMISVQPGSSLEVLYVDESHGDYFSVSSHSVRSGSSRIASGEFELRLYLANPTDQLKIRYRAIDNTIGMYYTCIFFYRTEGN